MRLLITTDTIGGVWRFAQELTKGLLDAGDSVALVSFGRAASTAQCRECKELTEVWGDRFLYISSDIPLEWMRENANCLERGAAILHCIAQEFGADLLHANQFCYGAAGLNIPAVVTAHSDVLSWAQACRREALEDTEWLRQYRVLVQKGLDGADAVTAPTEWMLAALAGNFLLPADTKVIANGRSVPVFDRGPRLLRAVTAGRLWDEAKDVALLGAVQSPVPLVIAGQKECDDTRTKMPDGVRMCGILGEEEMLRLLAESAVYVCTSRYEPFGLAPLEAALCGCALVIRDIASLREVWTDAALYFSDAKKLSAVLTRLADTPELLTEAQQRASRRARRYTRQKMMQEYRGLYAQLLAKDIAKERASVA